MLPSVPNAIAEGALWTRERIWIINPSWVIFKIRGKRVEGKGNCRELGNAFFTDRGE